ncbi:hypothetical protein AJ80_05951 [Polytolypa hystricis UAMH7299]|uniref:Uncharacterized protein n=1 Tax=Polytolypa hystricis (strain UAMH7299) TaxID=1447883 RepID=A0A2B7Y014_POLH7|nr:hypothetical protein AJ80_05951 [Polytolypa hystricis UAMH7299]
MHSTFQTSLKRQRSASLYDPDDSFPVLRTISPAPTNSFEYSSLLSDSPGTLDTTAPLPTNSFSTVASSNASISIRSATTSSPPSSAPTGLGSKKPGAIFIALFATAAVCIVMMFVSMCWMRRRIKNLAPSNPGNDDTSRPAQPPEQVPERSPERNEEIRGRVSAALWRSSSHTPTTYNRHIPVNMHGYTEPVRSVSENFHQNNSHTVAEQSPIRGLHRQPGVLGEEYANPSTPPVLPAVPPPSPPATSITSLINKYTHMERLPPRHNFHNESAESSDSLQVPQAFGGSDSHRIKNPQIAAPRSNLSSLKRSQSNPFSRNFSDKDTPAVTITRSKTTRYQFDDDDDLSDIELPRIRDQASSVYSRPEGEPKNMASNADDDAAKSAVQRRFTNIDRYNNGIRDAGAPSSVALQFGDDTSSSIAYLKPSPLLIRKSPSTPSPGEFHRAPEAEPESSITPGNPTETPLKRTYGNMSPLLEQENPRSFSWYGYGPAVPPADTASPTQRPNSDPVTQEFIKSVSTPVNKHEDRDYYSRTPYTRTTTAHTRTRDEACDRYDGYPLETFSPQQSPDDAYIPRRPYPEPMYSYTEPYGPPGPDATDGLGERSSIHDSVLSRQVRAIKAAEREQHLATSPPPRHASESSRRREHRSSTPRSEDRERGDDSRKRRRRRKKRRSSRSGSGSGSGSGSSSRSSRRGSGGFLDITKYLRAL